MAFKKVVGVIQIVFSLILFFLAIYLGLLRTAILGFLGSIPAGLLKGSDPSSALGYGVIITAVFIGITALLFLLQGIVNLLDKSSSSANEVPEDDLKKLPSKPKKDLKRLGIMPIAKISEININFL